VALVNLLSWKKIAVTKFKSNVEDNPLFYSIAVAWLNFQKYSPIGHVVNILQEIKTFGNSKATER
jgi:hypothetical protein